MITGNHSPSFRWDYPPQTETSQTESSKSAQDQCSSLCSDSPNKVIQDAKLVTMDVTHLYTNINTDLGINALKYWRNKYPQNINSSFSEEFILEASSLVLKNNTFSINGKYYLQLKGTAMGTKMPPTYATLTLGYLEEKMYEKTRQHFND